MRLLEQPGGYRDQTNALISEFGLEVPNDISMTLAKLIMFELYEDDLEAQTLDDIIKSGRWDGKIIKKVLEQRKAKKEATLLGCDPPSKKKRERLSERVASAINQTNALLIEKGDQSKHQDNLQKALSNIHLVVELALAEPSYDANHILNALADQSISKDDLGRLMASLLAVRDRPPSRRGRPRDNISRIVTVAAKAWKSAGRTIEFSCHDEVLSGPFADFLMAVFKTCRLPEPEREEVTALNQRLRSMKL